MKNIIDYGTYKPIYQQECYKCYSVFLYNIEDTYGKEKRVGASVTCPKCGAELYHLESNRLVKV